MPTVFEKIASREIPADIIHEEEELIAFRDQNPQAPVHILIVPKRCIARVGEAVESDESVLGRLLLAAAKIARQMGVLESGFRIVINHGADAGETVPHLHVHLLAGRPMSWPPG